jgi:hypothetical protein
MKSFVWLVAAAAVMASADAIAQGLDFAVYRTQVEPAFLKPRGALNGPCFVCHAKITSRLRLQPLPPGGAWTEEQSRRNFEAVSTVVVPGQPAQSNLLLLPLASEAGGSPVHPGGKVWQSRDDPEWKAIAAWIERASAAAAPARRALDYDAFKSRVQPIFLDKRAGLARCYVCHSQGTPFRLQALSHGSSSWSEEESRKNFDAVQRLVIPGDPASSRLLMMPLATDAGGDPFHPGGKRWTSKDDPEWQILAEWVRGAR